MTDFFGSNAGSLGESLSEGQDGSSACLAEVAIHGLLA